MYTVFTAKLSNGVGTPNYGLWVSGGMLLQKIAMSCSVRGTFSIIKYEEKCSSLLFILAISNIFGKPRCYE